MSKRLSSEKTSKIHQNTLACSVNGGLPRTSSLMGSNPRVWLFRVLLGVEETRSYSQHLLSVQKLLLAPRLLSGPSVLESPEGPGSLVDPGGLGDPEDPEHPATPKTEAENLTEHVNS